MHIITLVSRSIGVCGRLGRRRNQQVDKTGVDFFIFGHRDHDKSNKNYNNNIIIQ